MSKIYNKPKYKTPLQLNKGFCELTKDFESYVLSVKYKNVDYSICFTNNIINGVDMSKIDILEYEYTTCEYSKKYFDSLIKDHKVIKSLDIFNSDFLKELLKRLKNDF